MGHHILLTFFKDYRSIVLVVLFWSVLYIIGYPLPYVDDCAYAGTAVHIALDKGYVNSYCPSLDIFGAANNFYIYVPLHAYTLGGFLKICGISRATMAFFVCMNAAFASLFLCCLLAKNNKPIEYFLISFSVAIFLGNSGLRPDAMGLATFSGGLLLLKASSRLGWLFCTLLLWLCVICSPNFILLVFLVIGSSLWTAFRQKPTERKFFSDRLGITVISGSLVVLLFLWMIEFHLAKFLQVFLGVAASNRRYFWGAFVSVLSASRIGLKPMLQVFGFPIFVSLSYSIFAFFFPESRINKFRIVCISLGVTALLLGYFASAMGPSCLDCFCIIVSFHFLVRGNGIREFSGFLTWIVMFICFFFRHGALFTQLALLPLYSADWKQGSLQAKISESRPSSIYLDSFALSAIYDYKMPVNGYDFTWGVPMKWEEIHYGSEFPHGSVIVLSYQNAKYYGSLSAGTIQPGLIGAIFPSLAANPFQFVVIKVP